ncbi:hypothetical protein Tco_0559047 [Tanacetum coccineum]
MQPSFPELDSRFVVSSFNPSDDPIANLNKAMVFLSTTFSSRFPQINNQLRTSSNPRNQATIQDGRVTVQTIQGRQTQGYANNWARNTATNPGVNRQGALCTKLKRPKNSACFKEKMLLSKALESGAYLDPEHNVSTDDLDAFDSDCDDVPSAKAVLMENLSSYDLDVLSEVAFHDTNIENDMSSQSVQENQCSEQPFFDDTTEIDITSDSNINPYEQYLQETETLVIQSTSSSTQQDELLMSVIEEMSSQVAKCNKVHQENREINETLTAELERYKEQVKIFEQRQKFDLNDREKYIDGQLRQESKQKEDKYIDEVIDLKKKNKALDNVVYKMVIMEYLVKISKKARILELKRRHLKITVLITNMPYPSRKIRRICACTSQKTTKGTRSIRRIQG